MKANQKQLAGASGTVPLVFIVGMPRSGTKLLRDLLNRHKDIAIFPNESHFIPNLYHRYRHCQTLDTARDFHQLFMAVSETVFFQRLSARGIEITEPDWRRCLAGNQFSDAIRALFAWYRERTGARIVGDKTPEYITQVPLLHSLLPEARFVHIVRDPRDHVLSMRNAWGKNVLRAAFRWKQHISKYCRDVDAGSPLQITVRYEDLLKFPLDTITTVCDFLELDFRPEMTSLEVSSEELGDAKGINTVLESNTHKWVGRLTDDELEIIDSTAGILMSRFGYSPTHKAGDQDPAILRLMIWRCSDALSLLQFRRRTEGSFLRALRMSWRMYRHSGVDE